MAVSMPGDKPVELTAKEHLRFQAIIDYLTYPEPRRNLSGAMLRVERPQGSYVIDAWAAACHKIWRVTPGA
jgi:actin-like ATPase involved in cell morphogenesis